jgi:hypothetical protein
MAARHRQAADERAEALRPLITPLAIDRLSLGEIARRLDEMGQSPVRGKRFYAEQVKAILGRLSPLPH